MDRPSETRFWTPKESETLNGGCHQVGGLTWVVRTEDGSVWFLEAEAENQLVALHPDEGQGVRVSYKHDRFRRPCYDVTFH
jgi:hypothetical protein